MNSRLSPEILDDLTTVGASYILDGNNTEAKFTESLVREFGEEARPYGAEIFVRSKEKLDHMRKIAKIMKTPSELKAEIDPTKPISGKMVFNMVRGYLEDGVSQNEVLKIVHKDFQDIWPKVTYDDVSDAYTEYGKTKYPNLKESVESTLREDPKYIELLAKKKKSDLELAKAVTDWHQYLDEIRQNSIQDQTGVVKSPLAKNTVIIFRWFAVLPVATLAAILACFPLHLLVIIACSNSHESILTNADGVSLLYIYRDEIERFLQPLAFSMAFVLAGARIAPNSHFKIAVILCGVYVALQLIVNYFVITHFPKIAITPSFWGILLGAIGTVTALLIVRFNAPNWQKRD